MAESSKKMSLFGLTTLVAVNMMGSGIIMLPSNMAQLGAVSLLSWIITAVGLQFGALLGGAVLTETVFAWPGLGRYITDSLFNVDMNAVLGGTIVVGAVFIGLNLLSDMVYRLLDPRAR